MRYPLKIFLPSSDSLLPLVYKIIWHWMNKQSKTTKYALVTLGCIVNKWVKEGAIGYDWLTH